MCCAHIPKTIYMDLINMSILVYFSITMYKFGLSSNNSQLFCMIITIFYDIQAI